MSLPINKKHFTILNFEPVCEYFIASIYIWCSVGGELSVYVLLSLVNKLLGLISQNIGGWSRQKRMLGRREVSQTP